MDMVKDKIWITDPVEAGMASWWVDGGLTGRLKVD